MHTDRNALLINKVHFIGIGGIGMSALARIVLQRGGQVTGSDRVASAVTAELEASGAKFFIGHDKEHVQGSEVVIYNSDISADHIELQSAQDLGIPSIHRSDLLKRLMEGYQPLLVTGTHGKTTTSSLLAHLLLHADKHPAYAVGGLTYNVALGKVSNGNDGKGPYFVAEADESDGSFLKYHPFGAILTNIDNDHLNYWKTTDALVEGFKTFASKVESSQHLFWCQDDVALSSLELPGHSYGFSEESALVIDCYRQQGWKNVFDITFLGKRYLEIELPLIGAHNVLNASAVFGMGLQLGLEESRIRKALSSFPGVSRRMEKKGEIEGISFYDDYGHHPTEIFATLRAVKQAIGERRLIVAFQPHRYSRTRDCFFEFGPAFCPADSVILTDLYGAGEAPLAGVSTEELLEKMQHAYSGPLVYVPYRDLAVHLKACLQGGDVCVTMGAGDITKIGPQVLTLRQLL